MRGVSGWLLAGAVALFVGAVAAWIVSGPHRTVVRERGRTSTTIVEAPPLTPLRDSGPKNNRRTQTARRSGPSTGRPLPTAVPESATPAPQNHPLPSRKRPGPKTTPTPRPSSQGSQPPSQPPSPPPSQPPPVVGVTAPAPVTVCARPVATVNC